MKKIILSLIILFTISITNINAQITLNAEDSNPNKMGWMNGFPPQKDSILSVADGSFFQFPGLRYSVNHMRQFLPTVRVKSAEKNNYIFSLELDNNIDSILFTPWGSNEKMSWK